MNQGQGGPLGGGNPNTNNSSLANGMFQFNFNNAGLPMAAMNPTAGMATTKPNQQQTPLSKNSSPVVSDSLAKNSKQLLLAHVYNYLLENGMHESAKALLYESSVPHSNNSPITENDLLETDMLMNSPDTFLLEWWQILWSLHSSVNPRANQLLSVYPSRAGAAPAQGLTNSSIPLALASQLSQNARFNPQQQQQSQLQALQLQQLQHVQQTQPQGQTQQQVQQQLQHQAQQQQQQQIQQQQQQQQQQQVQQHHQQQHQQQQNIQQPIPINPNLNMPPPANKNMGNNQWQQMRMQQLRLQQQQVQQAQHQQAQQVQQQQVHQVQQQQVQQAQQQHLAAAVAQQQAQAAAAAAQLMQTNPLQSPLPSNQSPTMSNGARMSNSLNDYQMKLFMMENQNKLQQQNFNMKKGSPPPMNQMNQNLIQQKQQQQAALAAVAAAKYKKASIAIDPLQPADTSYDFGHQSTILDQQLLMMNMQGGSANPANIGPNPGQQQQQQIMTQQMMTPGGSHHPMAQQFMTMNTPTSAGPSLQQNHPQMVNGHINGVMSNNNMAQQQGKGNLDLQFQFQQQQLATLQQKFNPQKPIDLNGNPNGNPTPTNDWDLGF